MSVLAEVGGNVAGQGNVMRARRLDDMVVWAAAVRLHLDRLLPRATRSPLLAPRLELFVTNRVGSSPFHSLRARADNDLAYGAGLSVPLQF